uniref:Uncharacterized protein n=1 Tax=Petromyzon marinus TaxID=7757 RepID=S4RAB8_PETMA
QLKKTMLRKEILLDNMAGSTKERVCDIYCWFRDCKYILKNKHSREPPRDYSSIIGDHSYDYLRAGKLLRDSHRSIEFLFSRCVLR